jgi:putative nucleotidyltransferase with HDIG domain
MKPQILFVDDEEKVLQGFKRAFHSISNEWDMIFVLNGYEALKVLSAHNIDVIVSDMRMPGMDGVELLSIVQKAYQKVVRIIVSGYSDQENIIRTPEIAHRFIAKPCDAAILISIIKDILELRKRFKNPELLSIIASLNSLPSLPEFYNRLKSEFNSSDVSIKKIGEILSQDIAMSAKLLQLVNSAFFGLPQRISDPVQAINFLGIEVIKSLFLFEKVFSSINISDPYKIFYDEIYNHSVRVGRLAKEIAIKESKSPKISDEAFTGGLMHDIGKLICLRFPDYPLEIRKNMKIKGSTYIESELELYDTTHCELGAYLLHLWGLPENITNITEFHHNPANIPGDKFSALSAVYIANSVVNNSEPDYEYFAKIGVSEEIYNIFTNKPGSHE